MCCCDFLLVDMQHSLHLYHFAAAHGKRIGYIFHNNSLRFENPAPDWPPILCIALTTSLQFPGCSNQRPASSLDYSYIQVARFCKNIFSKPNSTSSASTWSETKTTQTNIYICLLSISASGLLSFVTKFVDVIAILSAPIWPARAIKASRRCHIIFVSSISVPGQPQDIH